MVQILTPKDAVEESWSWQNERFVDGKSVECINYKFPEKDKSFVHGFVEPGEEHGWLIAGSDYYYMIISGEGEVETGRDTTGYRIKPLKPGDCFCVPHGTFYNYRATKQRLEFVAFMNQLWNVKDDSKEAE